MDDLFHFLWINEDGEPLLPEMQLISLRSFIAHCHKVVLWTYYPIANVPQGAEVRDGNLILQLDYNLYEKRYFSNIFRYHLLYKVGGWWIDMDVVCMKPFVFKEPHVFASYDNSYDNKHSLNNNVIRAPKGSWIMKDWIMISKAIMDKKDDTPLILGPTLITEYFRTRKELRHLVMHSQFFNQLPVHTVVEKLAMMPYDPKLLEGSYGVHFYGWMWRPPHQVRLRREDYVYESFYCTMARKYLLPQEQWVLYREPIDTREEFGFMWTNEDPLLPEMQLMCLKSFLAFGHRVVLYTYGNFTNIPEGIEVREGKRIFPFNPRGKEPRFFSDLFRYHMLYNLGGWWIDMDVVCMKPFVFKEPHVFSLFDDSRTRYRFMNNDVIRAPKGSWIMKEFIELTKELIDKRPNINLIAGPDLLSRYFRDNRQFDSLVKEAIYFNQFPIATIVQQLAMMPYDPKLLQDPRVTGVHLCSWVWRTSKHKREEYHPESFYCQKVTQYLSN